MIRTFLLHVIYEQCIHAFFTSIFNNFVSPIIKSANMVGTTISAIQTIIESDGTILKIVYTDVLVNRSDTEGMHITAVTGTMQEYPIYDEGKIYHHSMFDDYILYEDIVEIFE